MRDPETGQYAKARNTNLNEDLGKVRRARVVACYGAHYCLLSYLTAQFLGEWSRPVTLHLTLPTVLIE